MEQVGAVYQKGRETYIVMWRDGDAYYFEGGAFYQGLTRFATRGCKLRDIEDLIPGLPEASEEITP
jgi:hypothetical protein